MALGLILVIGFAGIGAANLVTAEADSGVWSENSLNNRTCHDWHLTQLLRYHRQAVREL